MTARNLPVVVPDAVVAPEQAARLEGPPLHRRLGRIAALGAVTRWGAGERPPLAVAGVPHGAVALVAWWCAQELGATVLAVVADPELCWGESQPWLADGDPPPLLFPAPDTLPFDRVPPGDEVLRFRLRTLLALRSPRPQVVVTSLPALLRPTLAPAWLAEHSRRIERGSELELDRVVAHLLALGYRREAVVAAPGTFARRGGILDVFPLLDRRPWRAEWFGERVEGLWHVDPESQASAGRIEAVELSPAREIPLDPPSLARARGRLSGAPAPTLRADVAERWARDLAALGTGGLGEGAEALAPLLLDPAVTLLDHLPGTAVILVDDRARLGRGARRWQDEVEAIRAGEVHRGELPGAIPAGLAGLEDLLAHLAGPSSIDLRRESGSTEPAGAVQVVEWTPHASPSFADDFQAFAEHVRVETRSGSAVLVVSRQEDRVVELATEAGLDPWAVDGLDGRGTPLPDGALVVAPGELRGGLGLAEAGLWIHTDHDLFGGGKRRASILTRGARRAESSLGGRVRSASSAPAAARVFQLQLRPGDLVVHRDHGIARFLAMQRVAEGDGDHEYMQLEYADGHRLYVPVEHLDRVDRYVGGDEAHPQLSRLGTGEWERTRQRVRRRVDAIAKDLVELYASRLEVVGHAFAEDSRWQAELEAAFPYEETKDQLLVLSDIKRDMESPRPMDRLLCGDVGFGKTEIALRAAFKAAQDGFQVAVLVPTTVLAQQHHMTFAERLRPFPIRVEALSRLRGDAETGEVLRGLRSGSVDIVIGTHRLLQADVAFKNLGLVILDEEQRFGVRQKERFKQLRTAVDVLSLSATPIPRTLHMALSGIRDLSVIRTPPEDRVPIKTYVTAKAPELIQDVCRRELSRGGQVYYVHNRVQTIAREAALLRQLLPEARIAIAHGQMPEGELARVMVQFINGEVDVLCCTTIVESGLDIANVNTIVIDDATRLGLAQLYQLRGRVGRSGQRAYAYLLYDPARALSERADKRLDVIEDLQDLGAGFTLALRDLEIRGAGNVLGEAQHGEIAAVGLELYNHLLRQAVGELQGQTLAESPAQVAVRLPLAAHLPADFVDDERVRLRAYQDLAAAASEAELELAARTLRQRFGPLPAPAANLLTTLRVRLLAAAVGASAVETEGDDVVLQFERGAGERLQAVAAQFGRQLTAGPSRLRLHRGAAGGAWPERLLEVLRELGRLGRAGARPDG
ncbi:MAG TPA: transcription-repair coupling factor [Verrucomicrobiae bacterium]|nr:transcription-repair coupling factor [Verrucomicrobiae bacterium]